MRLNVNGNDLSLNSKEEFAKVVKDATDLLFKRYGKDGTITLEWTKPNLSYAINEKGKKIPQNPTQRGQVLSREYISEKTNDIGYQTVTVYSARKSHPADPSLSIFMPRRYNFKGRINLTVHDRELIFFLVFVSNKCELLKDKELSSYQGARDKSPWYYVHNERVVAQASIDGIQQKARIQYAIASNKDEYKLSRDQLVALGFVFGLRNPVASDDDTIRSFLLNLIERDTSKITLDKIDDLIQSKRKLNVNAVFYRAKVANVIGVKRAASKKVWCYKDEGGKFSDEIMTCSTGLSDDVQLINFMMASETEFEKLKFELDARKK